MIMKVQVFHKSPIIVMSKNGTYSDTESQYVKETEYDYNHHHELRSKLPTLVVNYTSMCTPVKQRSTGSEMENYAFV